MAGAVHWEHRGEMAVSKSLTAKQERFARMVVEGSTKAAAYREAYQVGPDVTSGTVHTEARRVAMHPAVVERIKALRAASRRRHTITVDTLTRELEEARQIAKLDGNAASMVSATMGKAKLHGLLAEQKVDPSADATLPSRLIIEFKAPEGASVTVEAGE